jgi:adenine deaminase
LAECADFFILIQKIEFWSKYMNNYEERIAVAHGEKPADLLLKNARIVNVFSGDIHESHVAVFDGIIVGLGDYDAKEIINLEGKYICPGFIDGHVHLESSMVIPSEFARAVVPKGTTSVVADPHEIANVLGLDGIRFMIEASKNLPLSVFIMLPSCVPATDMESNGAKLYSPDLEMFLNQDQVLGIAEMMNFPGVIYRDKEVLEKIRIAKWKRVDGHAPLLSGKDLSAYITAGITSDHECTMIEEGREKLRNGMYLMIREGTTAKNLKMLLPLVNDHNSHKCMFVTDDRHPGDLLDDGHIDAIVRQAISMGMDPIRAIQMATINTAEYFKLSHLGAIAPGYVADFLILDDLKNISVEKVFKNGILAAENGEIVGCGIQEKAPVIRSTINVNWMGMSDVSIKAEGKKIRVIGLIPDQIITEHLIEDARIENGNVVSDVKRDILKIVVAERHRASGNLGKGFVKGFGLKKGAIASSVAHDSHNIIVVGVDDDDILTAIIEIVKMQGGQVVVKDGVILESLPLPIAGLMSDQPLEKVRKNLDNLKAAARNCGCLIEDPFMQMAFLALPVIPSLKITDMGIVDVDKFQLTKLFAD